LQKWSCNLKYPLLICFLNVTTKKILHYGLATPDKGRLTRSELIAYPY
jgi:hypothetical protein